MRESNWPVTLSVGAVAFRTPPEDTSELIRRADRLLYEAKRAGKNGFLHETIDGTV